MAALWQAEAECLPGSAWGCLFTSPPEVLPGDGAFGLERGIGVTAMSGEGRKAVPGRSVSPRQVAVLRWVARGCPAGAWPDDTHKPPARALEARGLIAVSRRAGNWTAVIRPAGQHYLDHGSYPPGPPATTAPPPATPAGGAPRRPGESRSSRLPAIPEAPRIPHVTGQPAAEPPAEALISQIRASGGTLTVESESYLGRSRLDAQIRAIRRFGKLPC